MVTDADPVPPNGLLQLLSLVLTMLGAPARAWMRFKRWSDAKLAVLERTLQIMHCRGFRLRYEGESNETAEKRLNLVAWFMADPGKAQRHLGRLQRAGYRIFFKPGLALRFAAPAGAPTSDARAGDLCALDCAHTDSS